MLVEEKEEPKIYKENIYGSICSGKINKSTRIGWGNIGARQLVSMTSSFSTLKTQS